MAFAGPSKSPIAAAASLFVALGASAALAGTVVTAGFTLNETIHSTDASGNPITLQTKSVAPGVNTNITVAVNMTPTTDSAARPMLLTLNFTLPTEIDFVSVSGCTLPDNFDPSKAQPTCTVKNPFPLDTTVTPNKFGTNTVKVTLTVARHYDSSEPIPASCPTGTIGDVTVEAKTDVGDDLSTPADSPAVTLTRKAYADIDVSATAPTNANVGDTISVVGTIKNLGPCPATTVQIDPESANAAGVTLLTFTGISGACTTTYSVNAKTGVATPTPGEDGSCVIPTIAPGASTTITKTYHVDSVGLKGQSETMRTSGYANAGADQVDPNGGNDVADTSTIVPQDSGGGCSTGGAVGPMALLGMMLLFSRKRRTT